MSKHIVRFFLFTLFISNCYAETKLELTQGIYGAAPIVISVAGSKTVALNNVSSKISNDIKDLLSLSGEFKVKVGPSTLPSLDLLASYQKEGVSYVAFTKVEEGIGSGGFDVSLLCYDLLNDQNLDFAQPKKILRYHFTEENINLFSRVLADDIYSAINGYPGVFTTNIAYVLVQKKHGMTPIYSLKVANFDGSNQRDILQSYTPIMSPSWSHDGKKIAYVSFENNSSSIYIQDIESGLRDKISDLDGVNGAPNWSHDDSSIAVVLSDNEFTKIYKINLSDKSKELLTDGASLDTEPKWSSDDKYLFFTSNRAGKPNIYSYDFSANTPTRVTFKGDYNASPDVSADNKFIVYLHRNGGLFSIATQNLESGTVRVVSRDESGESPSFAPNSKIIAFSSRYGARGVLSLVSLDGLIKWRLPVANGDIQDPAWSHLTGYRDSFIVEEYNV